MSDLEKTYNEAQEAEDSASKEEILKAEEIAATGSYMVSKEGKMVFDPHVHVHLELKRAALRGISVGKTARGKREIEIGFEAISRENAKLRREKDALHRHAQELERQVEKSKSLLLGMGKAIQESYGQELAMLTKA